MNKSLLTIIAVFIFCFPTFGWSRLGHAVVAKIAEENLTPAAKERIDDYLHGSSIVEYSSYADEYRDILVFKDGKGFPHTFDVDSSWRPYHEIEIDGRRINNCVFVIDDLAKDLKDAANLSDSLRFLKIVLLVHFVGDMHCPEHVRYPEDLTIGKFPVIFRGEEITYHKFWDDYSLSSVYPWSFSDLAFLFGRCSKETARDYVKGSPYDWAIDCAQASWPAHSVKAGKTIGKELLLKSSLLAKIQIQKAGYRLAHLLNMTFDSKYAKRYQKACRSAE